MGLLDGEELGLRAQGLQEHHLTLGGPSQELVQTQVAGGETHGDPLMPAGKLVLSLAGLGSGLGSVGDSHKHPT